MSSTRLKTDQFTAVFCVFPCVILLTVTFLVVPIIFILFGSLHLSNCKPDPKLPIWMLCMGGLMLFERFLGAIDSIIDRKFQSDNPKPTEESAGESVGEWRRRRRDNKSIGLQCLLYLVRFTIFAGTLTGAVFTFSIYSQRAQCNGLVFWTSFLYCCVSLAIYSLVICLTACIFCFATMK